MTRLRLLAPCVWGPGAALLCGIVLLAGAAQGARGDKVPDQDAHANPMATDRVHAAGSPTVHLTPPAMTFITREEDVHLTTADQIVLEGLIVVPVPANADGTPLALPDPDPATADGGPGAAPVRRFPVVVLVHSYSRTRDTLIPLSDALAKAGIASVLMDLRGHGRSRVTTDSRLYTFPALPAGELLKAVGDERLVLERLRRVPDIDLARLGILGVGQGGLIAAAIASRGTEFKALVVVDPTDPVGGFKPTRDLGLFGARSALLLCSAFPQSGETARAWAQYGAGERTVSCSTAFDKQDRMLLAGSPTIAEAVAWLSRKLDAQRP